MKRTIVINRLSDFEQELKRVSQSIIDISEGEGVFQVVVTIESE